MTFKPAYTQRPCDHKDRPVPDECPVCYLYVHDERYRALYDGKPVPSSHPDRKVRPGLKPKVRRPKMPLKDMLQCVHLGDFTGEVRKVGEGFG